MITIIRSSIAKYSSTKKLLVFLFIICTGKTYAQYGDQSAITIPISKYQNAVALIHLPDDYKKNVTTKHPLIVGFPGSSRYGTNASDLTGEGLGNAIYTGLWDGNAVNPNTNKLEKFVAISILPPSDDAPISFSQVDYALTWIYSNYRIDTNCVALTGLSRGGGTTIYYPSHISYVNYTNRFIYQYSTPSHTLAAIIPMSAENNQDDPVNFLVTDSVHVWGFGSDTMQGAQDAHGVSTHLFVNHINAITPLARFTNYVGGHCCWNKFYDASFNEVIDGLLMNIYQFVLYHRRGFIFSSGILTGKIASSTYCVSDSNGAPVSISFISTGKFSKGNLYKVQLSSATGSFNKFTLIGTKNSTDNSGTINCIIPPGIATGTGYKIRVISTNPSVEGTNTSSFTLNLASNNIAPSQVQNITTSKSGIILTVTEQSIPFLRKWKYGKTLGNYNIFTGKTLKNYSPKFTASGTYYVICKSFYLCDSIISNPVKINVSASFMNAEVEQSLSQKTTFEVYKTSGYVSCNYAVAKNEKISITIYDEYGRANANFNGNQTAGSYTHTFNKHLMPGLYIVVFQSNQQKTISQKILVSN